MKTGIRVSDGTDDMPIIGIWLKNELDANGNGFYCNIVSLCRSNFEGKMVCIYDEEYGDPIGFYTWYETVHDGKVAFAINIINIIKEHKYKGYGKQLVRYAIEDFKKRGGEVIIADCISEESTVFFKNLGFKVYETTYTKYYVMVSVYKNI